MQNREGGSLVSRAQEASSLSCRSEHGALTARQLSATSASQPVGRIGQGRRVWRVHIPWAEHIPLLTPHWSELDHPTTPHCKGAWEM